MARRLHGWHEACCSLPAPPGDPVVATLQAFKEGGKAGARLAPLADALHSLQVDALHFPRSKVLDGQEGRVAQLGGCTKVKGVGGGGVRLSAVLKSGVQVSDGQSGRRAMQNKLPTRQHTPRARCDPDVTTPPWSQPWPPDLAPLVLLPPPA